MEDNPLKKEEREDYPLHARRLKTPYREFEPGAILLWIENTEEEHFEFYWGYGAQYFSQEELDEISEPVDAKTSETYLLSLKTQALNLPQAPTLQLEESLIEETLREKEYSKSQEIVPIKGNKIGQIRNQALAFANHARKIEKTLNHSKAIFSQHGEARKGQLSLQSKALQAQMEALQKSLKAAGEALHAINLYLGMGEEVIPICQGQKAPAEAPITIRQKILFMDEEAIFLDHEGIDCRKLGDFDRFLKDTDLISKILPEPKGIVVMQVTAHDYYYNSKEVDAHTQMEINEENAQTYWIVRNGENLWRFWCDLKIEEILFPPQGEIQQKVSEHAPGSRGYREDMEKAQGQQLTFLKAGLVIQGLLDRTLVLGPFPQGERPQITNPATWPGKLRLIEDHTGNLLTEGIPSFSEWLSQINGCLEAGQRVIVHKVDPDDVYPNGARGYNEADLLEIKKTPRGEFCASFIRTDEIFDGYNVRAPKTRGSVRLKRHSTDWLNFDSFIPEQAEPYLRSRSDREYYRTMVPLLTKAIELKKAEEAQEEPFLKLLIQEIAKLPHAPEDEETLRKHTKDCIVWWKTKNKRHRPLTGGEKENALAWKEILREAKTQLKIQTKSLDLPPLPENTVLAVRSGTNTIESYTPEEEIPPFFVTKTTWKRKKGEWIATEVLPHQKIGKADKTLNTPVRIQAWLDAQKSTSPHRQPKKLIFEKPFEEITSKGDFLCIVLEEAKGSLCSQKLSALFISRHTGRTDTPENKKIVLQNGSYQLSWDSSGVSTTVTEKITEEPVSHGTFIEDQWTRFWILHPNQENILSFQKRNQATQVAYTALRTKQEYLRSCMRVWEVCMQNQAKEKILHTFLQEGGNSEFFEDHLRTLPKIITKSDDIHECVHHLLFEQDKSPEELAGLTYEELDKLNDKPKKGKITPPTGFVCPAYKKQEEE